MRRFGILASLIVSTAVIPVNSHAEEIKMVWRVRSFHPEVVSVKFFSQSRRVAWPGFTRSWVINDYEVNRYSLACYRGEKICIGAGTDDGKNSWGAGLDGTAGCFNCCHICGEEDVPIQNLNQPR